MELLTPSQAQALELIKTGQNIFLKGVAGTGKTFLLNKLQELLPNRWVHLTASSGSAALNLNNGRTVSSFLGLGKYDEETYTGHCPVAFFNHHTIVIDEIGLIGHSQWQYILKSIAKNSYHNESPQIIICGDPAQMPPIYWDKALTKKDLKGFVHFELTDIVRQSDAEFISHLQKMRRRKLSKKTLSYFQKKQGNIEKKGMRLVIDRGLMDAINEQAIKEINAKKHTINLAKIKDEDKPYQKLTYFVGMKVVITRNRYDYGEVIHVNGDTGVITDIYSDSVLVKLDRTDEEVNVFFYQNTFSEKTKKGKVKTKYYSYLPLLPAYAMSIRRAQGITLELGVIDKSIINSKNRPAQYTAFSRFKSPYGIFLD